jgi:hypothetical protein
MAEEKRAKFVQLVTTGKSGDCDFGRLYALDANGDVWSFHLSSPTWRRVPMDRDKS